jgi:hypothetical protein
MVSNKSYRISCIRQTTLMPAVPGITALLTMIFSHKLELRVERSSDKYTGCVSGLGTENSHGAPVYPEHDIEVIFDVDIDRKDLEAVNRIRSGMDNLLSKLTLGMRELSPLQANVRTELIE